MMNSISPLGGGTPKGLHSTGATGSGPQDTGAVGGRTVGLRSASPSGIGDTSPLAKLGNQIGQLLQGIGGGLENNKVLQLMIGLMILLTLLEGSAKGGQSAADPLSGLGSGDGGRGAYGSMEASTTSITIEHTSMTMTASSVETMAASADDGQAQGQNIDLAA